jgi:hypothetical protein
MMFTSPICCPIDPGPEIIDICDCGNPPADANTPTVMLPGVASTGHVGSLGGVKVGGDPLYGCYEHQPFNGIFGPGALPLHEWFGTHAQGQHQQADDVGRWRLVFARDGWQTTALLTPRPLLVPPDGSPGGISGQLSHRGPGASS